MSLDRKKEKLLATYGRTCGGGGVCYIKKDMAGKVIIVTGANTGIGKETARILAQYGATIILAGRDVEKTTKVTEEIKELTGNKNLEFIRLDLSDLRSVKEFADKFKQKYSRLDQLINNAGVMAIPNRRVTKDGFEMQFGTNHVGHFYLTSLLLETLKASAPSRIINVSSSVHDWGKIHWDNLNAEKKYSMNTAYFQSKLANVMHAKELQKRLKGTGVECYSLHPGAVRTELTRYGKESALLNFANTVLLHPGLWLFGKRPIEGAQTTLYCALEETEKLEGGGYYRDCKIAKEGKRSKDEADNRRLWEVTEQLIAEKVNW